MQFHKLSKIGWACFSDSFVLKSINLLRPFSMVKEKSLNKYVSRNLFSSYTAVGDTSHKIQTKQHKQLTNGETFLFINIQFLLRGPQNGSVYSSLDALNGASYTTHHVITVCGLLNILWTEFLYQFHFSHNALSVSSALHQYCYYRSASGVG